MMALKTKILYISSSGESHPNIIDQMTGAKHTFDVLISQIGSNVTSDNVWAKIRHTESFVNTDEKSLAELTRMAVSRRRHITLAVAPFPPFLVPKPNGQWSGVDGKVWKAVATNRGLQLKYTIIPNLVKTVGAVRIPDKLGLLVL